LNKQTIGSSIAVNAPAGHNEEEMMDQNLTSGEKSCCGKRAKDVRSPYITNCPGRDFCGCNCHKPMSRDEKALAVAALRSIVFGGGR